MSDWRPGASLETLVARARLFEKVRAFFKARGVLEVDTPILASSGVTDPAIECIHTEAGDALQSSPEYFMKRLLAAGSGPIYQIARAFRAEESGRLHNPEFLLLEWYRPGFDDCALMDEVEALVCGFLPGFPARRQSYRTLFETSLGIDPFAASESDLVTALQRHLARAGRDADPALFADADRGLLLDFGYAEAAAAAPGAVFVHDFPPDQAALARLRRDDRGVAVAARFELVVDGVELANGYHELTDPEEQRCRFEDDLAVRASRGQRLPAVDTHLLRALEAGVPDCAGVALGLDRLLLLARGETDLDRMLPFGYLRV